MKPLVIWLLCIIVATAAQAQQTTEKQVDALFAKFQKPGSPGCSVGVIHDGGFVYKKSFGYASLELAVPLTPESVFYVGSVSKQFTAASVVLAAEQGYLSLDDDVHKYIPELPDYGHPVTLRQMLHQTSGFRDLFDLIYLSGGNPAEVSSKEEIFKLIARQKGLNNVPGAEWIYSNSNYFLLAEVVQRTTKKSLAQFAAKNIFQPLGMTHTLFYDDNTLVIPNRVAAYDPGKNGNFQVDWSTTYQLVGGGGVMSTVNDLVLWDRNFYANKLGNGTLIQELQSHGMLNDGNQIDYAMGLSLGKYRGLPTVEHDGALFGYRSEFLRFPQQRFSAILLCNLSTAGPETLAHKVADLYLAKDFAPEPALPDSTTLPDPAPFAGTYLDPRTKTIYTFTLENGKLMGWGAVLRRLDANKFYDLLDDVITFEQQDGTMHASLSIPGELYFSGDKLRPTKTSAEDVAQYTGAFHSDELNVTYTVSVENGRLTLKIPDNEPLPLKEALPGEFYSDGVGTIVFQSESGHHASGFQVFMQAARGISFKEVH